MNVKEAINLRKSIRKYKNKKISEEIINELLEAARKAPSAKNTQSHRYFIVKNGEIKDQLIKHGAFKQSYRHHIPRLD